MCGVMLCSEKNMFRMGKRVFSLNQTLVFLSGMPILCSAACLIERLCCYLLD
uniref:Uncharacterized protein n=1 Tax=Triticum urartu TaxID=4572 RepID=A0A8R7UXS2_TRIUA